MRITLRHLKLILTQVGNHREVAKSFAALWNRLNAIKAVGSEVTPSAKSKNCSEASESSVGNGAESVDSSRNALGSSSLYFC